MSLNKKVLFAYLRRAPFGGKLTTSQVVGIELILATWQKYYPDPDIRWVANSLAQIFHETGGRMTPVRESFASSDRQAKARLESAWARGKLPWVSKPYWRDGYFGRGHIQITHMVNYRRLGLKLGIDLVAFPGKALDPKTSAKIAIIGMVEGLFTNKKLEHFFNEGTDDPIGARKIVNGTDKQHLIAGYHRNFLDALDKASTSDADDLSDVDTDDYTPDDAIPSWKTLLASGLGAIGLSAQLSDQNALWYSIPILVIVLALGWYLRRKRT